MNRNTGISLKMSYFTHIFDVIYDLVRFLRNKFYFYGLYRLVNAGKSGTNLIENTSDLFSLWIVRRRLHIDKTQNKSNSLRQ